MVDYVDQVVDLVLTDLGRKQRDQPADEQGGDPGDRSGDKDDPFVFFPQGNDHGRALAADLAFFGQLPVDRLKFGLQTGGFAVLGELVR